MTNETNTPAYEEQPTPEELEQAKQEEYYWHCIAEFYGMLKFFGIPKVMADLETFRKTVEKPKDEPRIQLL